MKVIKIILKTVAVFVAVLSFLLIAIFIYYRFFNKTGESMDVELYFVKDLPVEPNHFRDEFKAIHEIVSEKYSLAEYKGIDLKQLGSEFKKRASKAQDRETFGLLLQEYFARLKVSHSKPFFYQYKIDYYTPTVVGDTIIVTHPYQAMIDNGFEPNDIILEIDHTPVPEWIDQMSIYTSASTPSALRYKTAMNAFKHLTDSTHTYTVLRQDGDTTVLDVTLHSYIVNSHKTAPIVATTLQDSIGYMAINTMSGDIVKHFREAYLPLQELPYLIIDIRNNGGGNSMNGKEIAAYLIPNSFIHCLNGRTYEPEEEAYKGELYLLTSLQTASAAESFTLDLIENSNVTSVGMPTDGDTGNRPRTFSSPNGIFFNVPTAAPSVSPKGFPLEGTNIEPHYLVPQQVSDLLKGEDTQLNFILHLISQ